MKSCPRCLNLSADTAVACEHCGTVWDNSVIARAESGFGARIPTVVEAQDRPRPTPPPVSGFQPTPPPPRPGGGTVPAGMSGRRGQTLYMPPPSTQSEPGVDSGPAAPRVQERKVIGVLVTYSWKPEGQVFPVREGRNLIGRGEECDIRVPEDPMLSQVNSHITFRQNFVVGDMVSMSGTDLNGDPVEEQFRQLGNYAQIRTGSTHWTFVIIDSALANRAS
jgi:FHA domain